MIRTRSLGTAPGTPLALCALLACWLGARAADTPAQVTVKEVAGKVRVEIGGTLFTEYHYQNVSRPFLYPILGPDGLRLTRHWPIEEAPDEDRDHPHHRSLWYTHGDINGHDFWSEGARAGQTVHVKFLELQSGPIGVIRSHNRLVAKDGTVVGTEDFTIRIHGGAERLVDFDVTVHASAGPLTFGDTKEGTLGIRLAETMRLKPNKANTGKPTGHIVNSEGVRDGATWGKRAPWVDYHGPVAGQLVGVAIFDHPQNPRHPTWWHVRDYGLFAANPFGLHDFERKPAGAGNLVVPANDRVTFRYRFYFHRGDERAGRVAEHYRAYADAPVAAP